MRRFLLVLLWLAAGCPAPTGVPCDPATFVVRCDDNSLVSCTGKMEAATPCNDATCNATEARCGACGDGLQQPGEACDDGNTTAGDGCSAACTVESCGDGIKDTNEQCDDGNASNADDCLTTCRAARCGDAFVQAGVEECDDGNSINDATCEADCTLPRCGNGVRDANEACDDGNLIGGDGCQADCSLPRCGDGTIDPGEGCDDGNLIGGDGCQADCSLPRCGDSTIDPGEGCDDGNLIGGDGCQADCSLPRCGDSTIDPGEGCDDGNLIGGDGCQADCSLPRCGDSTIDPGEGCDDGNLIDTDACPGTCQKAACGDSFVQAGIEQCDDGNTTNDATCEADCTTPVCGNGVVDAGEQCDDHNLIDNDGCDQNCTQPACGNGILNANEECDDANADNSDGCTTACLAIVLAARRAPRSSPVAISEDDAVVVMANTDTGSVSIFDTSSRIRVAELAIAAGSEPWAVAISPDSTRALVLLRKTGALVEVNDINTPAPSLGRNVSVGAEPTGLLLSPSGRIAYVTSFVEGAVYVIDTRSFSQSEIFLVGDNPRGLCMTNDGDGDDFDETLFVTQFFGLPSGVIKAGVLPLDRGSEGTDFGRKGVVNAIRTADNRLIQNVDLSPVDVTGFQNAGADSGAYPNQLATCTVHNGRVYVPNMAVSPRGPVAFNTNVQGLVSVFDIQTLTEVPGNNAGQRSGTVNLNNLIKAQSAAFQGRQFFTVPADIAFLPGTDTGFAVSSASDLVMPVEWRADGSIVLVPAAGTLNIPMTENPVGMVIDSVGGFGFVANRVSRNLKVVDLTSQVVVATIASAAVPVPGQAGFNELRGFKSFSTSTVRWSQESWGSCTGCHPDGLSDNATWHFAAGPRQTVPMDGTFSKTDPTDQRILTWTGIFDEVHDFNGNTLNVSGAVNNPGVGATVVTHPGAIVTSDGSDANVSDDLLNVAAVDTDGDGTNENHAGLNGGAKLVVNNVSIRKDWNQIEVYFKTIRPMEASRLLDLVSASRGRAVFIANKCQDCHGGSKWTISRRSFTPNLADAAATVAASNVRKATALANVLGVLNQNTLFNSAESVGFVSPYDPTLIVTASAATALNRIACVLRDVGTFGLFDPATDTRDSRIEVADDMTSQAEGIMGFNPPSLFSLSVTAPYLHHGQAATLDDLFGPRFSTHHQARSATFLASLDDADPGNDAQSIQDRDDLIAFLLSIDPSTAIIAPTAGQDICPNL